jgi:hypothetical protein
LLNHFFNFLEAASARLSLTFSSPQLYWPYVFTVGLRFLSFYLRIKIIQRFVNAANQKLNTPVKIGKIDVSMFSDFPNMAIVLTDVYVEDSHPGNYPLLTADRMAFNLNALELWKGNYSIRGSCRYRQRNQPAHKCCWQR